MHGLKQSSCNWFQNLRPALLDRKFRVSTVVTSAYFAKNEIAIVRVHDVIRIAKYDQTYDSIVKSLFKGNEKFNMKDEGTLDKCLGIAIK